MNIRNELKASVEQAEAILKMWKKELNKFNEDNTETFDEEKRLKKNIRIATKSYQEALVAYYEAGSGVNLEEFNEEENEE